MIIPVLFKGYCPECEADSRNERPECPQCDTPLVKVEKEDDNNYPISDANHQFRKKAIEILETIANKLGKPKIFDCRGGNNRWYDFEDTIVEILSK